MSRLAPGQAFSKLEALGNDFVLLDFRPGREDPPTDQIRMLADRHTGIGCDQLLILHAAADPGADCQVNIYNADGSVARQCGNGMRAVALWLHQARPDQHRFVLQTVSGAIKVEIETEQAISADMGAADFDPAAAGLDAAVGVEDLARAAPGGAKLGTVSLGNPHLVVLLQNPAAPEAVEQLGRELSQNHGFADGVNVSFACIEAPDQVSLRVYERGVGPTRACGSAACATAAWLLHQGLVEAPVRIEQPGGMLVIDCDGSGQRLLMQGPARRVFDGILQ